MPVTQVSLRRDRCGRRSGSGTGARSAPQACSCRWRGSSPSCHSVLGHGSVPAAASRRAERPPSEGRVETEDLTSGHGAPKRGGWARRSPRAGLRGLPPTHPACRLAHHVTPARTTEACRSAGSLPRLASVSLYENGAKSAGVRVLLDSRPPSARF